VVGGLVGTTYNNLTADLLLTRRFADCLATSQALGLPGGPKVWGLAAASALLGGWWFLFFSGSVLKI
jgi:hypothetical protein